MSVAADCAAADQNDRLVVPQGLATHWFPKIEAPATGATLEMKMKGYVANIDQETVKNGNFRKVLFTSKHHQLVVMSLKPGEDIGMEKHDVDQFIRVEKGHGLVEMDGTTSPIQEDSAVIVPAGARHNVRNTSKESDLKIYTVYSSPQHEDGAIHKTKAEAEEEEE